MAERTKASELPKLWVIIKREFIERVRTKWFIISTLLIPLLIGGTSILPVWLASRTKASDAVSSIRIIDATGKGLGARVASVLAPDSARAMSDSAAAASTSRTRGPEVRATSASALSAVEDSATWDVMAKRLPGYLVLDSTTVKDAKARYAGRNASTVPDVERIRSAVRQAVTADRMEASGLDSAQISKATNVRVDMPTIKINDKGKGGAGGIGGFFLGFMIAFLMYMVMALYGQQVLRGVMEEKTTRVAEVVVSSVRPVTLMSGKVLGVGAVAIVQQILWIGISSATLAMLAPVIARLGEKAGTQGTVARTSGRAMMAGAMPTIDPMLIVAVIVFFLLGYLFYASLFAAVGATVNSEQDAQQASAPIAFLLIPSFVFVQPIALNPTGTLAKVMSFLPFSAPIIMPMRMSLVEVPAWEIAVSFASALGGCVLAIWFAARIYRVGLLMYGKRPTYRELAKWLRYS
jgi:ABC-2 type transport system permease protein